MTSVSDGFHQVSDSEFHRTGPETGALKMQDIKLQDKKLNRRGRLSGRALELRRGTCSGAPVRGGALSGRGGRLSGHRALQCQCGCTMQKSAG